jgi:hypothetical protein
VEHERCAHCRNPIRGRQARVQLSGAGMSFHVDCWGDLHSTVQAQYAERARELGLPALLGPYQRGEGVTWLPGAVDEPPGDDEQLEDPEDEPMAG